MIAAGQIRPSSGLVIIDGERFAAPQRRRRFAYLAYLPQTPMLPPTMRVETLIRAFPEPSHTLLHDDFLAPLGTQRIEQLSGGALEVQQGALYPALYRLQHHGLIESKWGTSDNNRRAKFYRLTPAGRRQLGEQQASWHRLVEAMTAVLTATPQEI